MEDNFKISDEELWRFIDGTSDETEHNRIANALENSLLLQQRFEELMAFDTDLKKLDLEMPSMAFNRRVMDEVSVNIKPVALKTKVDSRIIYAIGALFTISMLGILIYAFSTSDFGVQSSAYTIDLNSSFERYLNRSTLYVFLLIDIAIGLIFLDVLLRKKSAQKKENHLL